MATTNETSVIFHPRNNPLTAISFISPPPNAPGTTIVNIKSGTLTQNPPIILDIRLSCGMVNIEIIKQILAKINIRPAVDSAVVIVPYWLI